MLNNNYIKILNQICSDKPLINILTLNAHQGIASYTEKRTETSIKKQLQKIERKVGMEYQKNTNKGSKDGNKGQGSSLLLFVLSLWLLFYQALENDFE